MGSDGTPPGNAGASRSGGVREAHVGASTAEGARARAGSVGEERDRASDRRCGLDAVRKATWRIPLERGGTVVVDLPLLHEVAGSGGAGRPRCRGRVPDASARPTSARPGGDTPAVGEAEWIPLEVAPSFGDEGTASPKEVLWPRLYKTGLTKDYLMRSVREEFPKHAAAMQRESALADLGVIDPSGLSDAVAESANDKHGWMAGHLFFTFQAEYWLRSRLSVSDHMTSCDDARGVSVVSREPPDRLTVPVFLTADPCDPGRVAIVPENRHVQSKETSCTTAPRCNASGRCAS